MTDYKNFVIEILKKASDIAKNNFGKVSGTSKSNDSNQVLTKTDIEIGKLIVSSLYKKYPNHNIIDEEAGIIDNKSQYTWVVDPIDGTSNFANGIPTYGILVGLLDGDTPLIGGVSMPEYSEIYFAEKGKGAFCNEEALHISTENKLINTLVAYGIDGHQENPNITKDECDLLSEVVLNIRNLRASNSVFDYMMVAKGKYGAYLNRTSKIWDNVAPQLIIEEAGGIYTDFFGKPIDYSNPLGKEKQNFTFCAAAPNLHKQLQLIINSNK
ncbi:MAG: inositol monophosphatase [Microgenomates group bacterium]